MARVVTLRVRHLGMHILHGGLDLTVAEDLLQLNDLTASSDVLGGEAVAAPMEANCGRRNAASPPDLFDVAKHVALVEFPALLGSKNVIAVYLPFSQVLE